MITSNLLIISVVLMLCWVMAAIDLKTFTIPNYLSMSVIILFLFVAPFVFDDFGLFALQWICFFIAFILSFMLYLIGPMGGGDVKFFAVLSLFVAYDNLWFWMLCVTLSGLAISLFYIIFRVTGLKIAGFGSVKDSYIEIRNAEIPYGPAITLGTTLLVFFTR